MVLGNLFAGRDRGEDIENRLADIAGKGVTSRESSIEAYTMCKIASGMLPCNTGGSTLGSVMP